MSEVDLHIHTTASDGRFTPVEIVRQSIERGMTIIGIADHDTVNGIKSALSAAEAYPSIRVIPGVEISADVQRGEVHVLGYFIDYTDDKLKDTLESLRHSRIVRAQGMITKLGDLGININWQRVQEIAGSGAIGRPHLAQAMLEKGYISSLKEAFINYIGKGGPAYVEREKLTPVEAVELIIQAEGLPVLAHPLTADNPEELVVELKKAGLVGIEAYYADYESDKVDRLVRLAEINGLVTTGGSDYHGLDEDNETAIGGAEVPLEAIERFIALARQKGKA